MTAPKLTGNRCQCPTCGECFTSTRAFDRHRSGSYAKPNQPNTRRCLTADEMDTAGFDRNARGFRGEPGRVATYFDVAAPRGDTAMGLPSPARDALEMTPPAELIRATFNVRTVANLEE